MARERLRNPVVAMEFLPLIVQLGTVVDATDTTPERNCLSRRRWERRGRAKLGCGEGSGRRNRADEACRVASSPLCDQASAWPHLPHFVGETKTPTPSPLPSHWPAPQHASTTPQGEESEGRRMDRRFQASTRAAASEQLPHRSALTPSVSGSAAATFP